MNTIGNEDTNDKTRQDKTTLTYAPYPGQDIGDAAKEALDLSKKSGKTVSFEFNEIGLTVTPQLTPDDIVQTFHTNFNKKAEEYRNSPEGKAASAARERRAVEARNLNASIDQKISDVQIELKDPDAWNKFVENNTDPYGAGVVRFAERWAKLMQVEMASGKKLKDIAQQTSHDADNEGITGFMYGCAVSTLAQTWEHGEKLRRWHNKDVQLGNEGDIANENGGVLNPALLTMP